MTKLLKVGAGKLSAVLGKLEQAGATVEDAEWLDDPNNAARLMRIVRRVQRLAERNPFEISVDETLQRFADVAVALSWQFPEPMEQIIGRLRETAMPWPRGREAYRSLRIRWGTSREGVIQTFEEHIKALKYVRPATTRWELVLSGEHKYDGKDVDRLRLLNGNDTHHPVVEWVIISDLSAHRKRRDITSVRGSTSLADEGLTLAWLFPQRVDAIDYQQWPAWFLGGYELNVPEGDDEPWQRVPIVLRDGERPSLDASWRGSGDPSYSVPSLGSGN